ncbi:MAG: hypothetical protein V3W51_07205 [Candidatus Brocadiales bacterium]
MVNALSASGATLGQVMDENAGDAPEVNWPRLRAGFTEVSHDRNSSSPSHMNLCLKPIE